MVKQSVRGARIPLENMLEGLITQEPQTCDSFFTTEITDHLFQQNTIRYDHFALGRLRWQKTTLLSQAELRRGLALPQPPARPRPRYPRVQLVPCEVRPEEDHRMARQAPGLRRGILGEAPGTFQTSTFVNYLIVGDVMSDSYVLSKGKLFPPNN